MYSLLSQHLLIKLFGKWKRFLMKLINTFDVWAFIFSRSAFNGGNSSSNAFFIMQQLTSTEVLMLAWTSLPHALKVKKPPASLIPIALSLLQSPSISTKTTYGNFEKIALIKEQGRIWNLFRFRTSSLFRVSWVLPLLESLLCGSRLRFLSPVSSIACS